MNPPPTLGEPRRELEWDERVDDDGYRTWESDSWRISEYVWDGKPVFSLSSPGADYRFRQSYGDRPTIEQAKQLRDELVRVLEGEPREPGTPDSISGLDVVNTVKLTGLVEQMDWWLGLKPGETDLMGARNLVIATRNALIESLGASLKGTE